MRIATPFFATVLSVACVSVGKLAAYQNPTASELFAECRRLAASPYDPGGTARGVDFNDGDSVAAMATAVAAAIAACGQADAEAARLVRLAADQGDAHAQSNLGWLYANGRGVVQNDAEAVRWYRLAADQGRAHAQSNLGVLYRSGRGVAQNDAEAVRWFRQAADQGDADAQSNLGTMYEHGKGVVQNDAEAVRWYRLAADQGNVYAQCNLGWMYEYGRGVAKSDAEAVRWYRFAAEQGYARAQTNLGTMYEHAKGVSADMMNVAFAATWYMQAANTGDHRAQLYLGLLYLDGRGVRKDRDTARRWLSMAQNSPDERIAMAASRGLDERETQLSGAEVAVGALLGLVILGVVFGGDGPSNSNDMDQPDWEAWNQKQAYDRYLIQMAVTYPD